MRHDEEETYNVLTYGDPQSVSAIIALGNERANPKSAILRIGIPKGWPLASSSGDAGLSSRFWTIDETRSSYGKSGAYLGFDIPMYEIAMSQEFKCSCYEGQCEFGLLLDRAYQVDGENSEQQFRPTLPFGDADNTAAQHQGKAHILVLLLSLAS